MPAVAGVVANASATIVAVTGKIKLALTAGKANPAPPIGPALGSKVGSSIDKECIHMTTHEAMR